MGNTPISRFAAATLRWRSLLGISVGLFLAWDLLNAALAIYALQWRWIGDLFRRPDGTVRPRSAQDAGG
jgi:hypothetical protein